MLKRPRQQPTDPSQTGPQNGQQTNPPSQPDQAATPVQAQEGAPTPPIPANTDPLTFFVQNVLMLGWFKTVDEFDKNRLAKLRDYIQLETMAPNENGGFDLKLANNSIVSWVRLRQEGYADQEFIHGQSKGFGDAEADAIIALSAVRGWEPINVHGTDHEKDLLWLAAQKQGLNVANYEPAPNSDIRKRLEDWQNEQKAGPVVTAAQSIPVVTPANPAGNGTGNSGGPAPVDGKEAQPAQQAQPTGDAQQGKPADKAAAEKQPAQQQQQHRETTSKDKPASKAKEPADAWWHSKEYADLFVGLADGMKSVVLDKKQIENKYIWPELMKRGIEVANYTPHKNSKVWKEWLEWQKNNPPVQTAEPSRAAGPQGGSLTPEKYDALKEKVHKYAQENMNGPDSLKQGKHAAGIKADGASSIIQVKKPGRSAHAAKP